MAQKLGVEPDNIVFSNTVKLPSHLLYAAEKGVSLMTFDSKNELAKIKEFYPGARPVLHIVKCQNGADSSIFPDFGDFKQFLFVKYSYF